MTEPEIDDRTADELVGTLESTAPVELEEADDALTADPPAGWGTHDDEEDGDA